MVDDIVTKIADWEEGRMDALQEEEFFQELVSSGLAWKLQGMYGRRAQQLINEGRIIDK